MTRDDRAKLQRIIREEIGKAMAVGGTVNEDEIVAAVIARVQALPVDERVLLAAGARQGGQGHSSAASSLTRTRSPA